VKWIHELIFSFTGKVAPELMANYIELMGKIEPVLNDWFDKNKSSCSSIKISYCPTILTSEFLEYLSEPYQFDDQTNILYCTPDLDYDKFSAANQPKRIEQLLDGLSVSDEIAEIALLRDFQRDCLTPAREFAFSCLC
jgi:hypothetical protein